MWNEIVSGIGGLVGGLFPSHTFAGQLGGVASNFGVTGQVVNGVTGAITGNTGSTSFIPPTLPPLPTGTPQGGAASGTNPSNHNYNWGRIQWLISEWNKGNRTHWMHPLERVEVLKATRPEQGQSGPSASTSTSSGKPLVSSGVNGIFGIELKYILIGGAILLILKKYAS